MAAALGRQLEFHAAVGEASLTLPVSEKAPGEPPATMPFSTGASPGSSVANDARRTPSRQHPEPATIGRYRIIRRLGQGGFGRVYLAHDDDLDRPVAIKVPNPERIARPEDVEAYLDRSPHPRQAGPSPHRAGL